ncbi:nuclear RNA export factor 1-like [Actinia tenebrosa]|uniref:Nuclear RNA export factor 1-like n=1 Tax=Actinia tenebrosa TaxID=6105 RepID=A0A6P8HTF6_ACTTE|nr:nuclear RNA export factor 1-like [Actinia tenebrosa]
MAGLFGKAMKDASLSVTTTREGSRTFDQDNQDSSSNSNRGGYRGRSQGRGQKRGRGRGNYWRPRGRGGRGRANPQNPTPRSYLIDEEDDESMGDEEDNATSFSRYTPYGTRPPSRRGFQNDRGNNRGTGGIKRWLGNQPQGKSDWYKVAIVKGKQHDKDWLLRKLQNASEEAFQPVEFHYKGDTAMFFVEGSSAADALKKVSHQITVKDGSKLTLTVRQSERPFMTNHSGKEGSAFSGTDSSQWNAETEQALKECLSNRYNMETKTMDLSDLFHDEVLKANNVQGSLYRAPVANAILKLIGENCPDMQGLDMSDNRLYNLEAMKDLPTYAPSIQHLKLSNNQMRNIEELDKLKGLTGVVTLFLNGNPFCDKFEGKESSYISAVRSRFPKVLNLDGVEHAPPIGFDLATTTALPKVQGSYLVDPEIKKLLLSFLEQYFRIYDSNDRQPLLEAYHDQAIFSMSVNPGSFNREKGPRGPSLGEYMKSSRNMIRRKEQDVRASLIKHNRLSVVAMLNELPPTTHELSSFVVDVSLAIPTCLHFSIRGFFMEGNKTMRSFTRVFVALPAAGGKSLKIVNDELHVRGPALPQIQAFKKQQESITATSTLQVPAAVPTIPTTLPTIVTVPTLTPSTSLTTLPIPSGLTPEQQQMILQFSRESRMNAEWSKKCLADNGWDYQKSAECFTSLNNQGLIPPGAFIKT